MRCLVLAGLTFPNITLDEKNYNLKIIEFFIFCLLLLHQNSSHQYIHLLYIT